MRFTFAGSLMLLLIMNAFCENPYALIPPKERNPSLPNVLLLGDSISIGYAPFVEEAWAGRANVYRIQGTEALTVKPAGGLKLDTAAARAHLAEWLGETQWDVIHFNWGLHDLKLVGNEPVVNREEYLENLRDLVAQLNRTGAKLVWASTTPIPVGVNQGAIRRVEASEIAYNEAAAKLMAEAGIPIDDLHSVAAADASLQRPANVHFTPEGSRKLAESVGRSLEPFLGKPGPAASLAPLELRLWEGRPPHAVADAGPGEDDGTGRIRNVGIPGMAVHFPAQSGKNRRALLVCPGGGYVHLTQFAVGNGTVAEFVKEGVVVIVLRYRTTPPSPRGGADALADAKRAMRLTRTHAAEWGIDPQQIGMIGWSAGANLTLNLASHFDNGNPAATDPVEREGCRPQFSVMLCPWPGGRPITDFPITAEAPPAFIASARDDETAPTRFAEEIAESYAHAGVPAKLWQIEAGGHRAFSYRSTGEGALWPTKVREWLAATFPAKALQ